MNHSTPSTGCSQLSSGLKERLKKCGRYHQSPLQPGSTVSPGLQAAVTDQSTPNRKRLSSSPVRSKVPNKRQILKCTDPGETAPLSTPHSADNNSKEASTDQDCLDSKVNLEERMRSKGTIKNAKLGVQTGSYVKVSTADNASVVENKHSAFMKEKKGVDVKESRDIARDTSKDNRDHGLEDGKNIAFVEKKDRGLNKEKIIGDDKEVKKNDRVPEIRNMCSGYKSEEDKPDNGEGCTDEAARPRLLKDLQEKQETLRQLKMVQMYRTKNDLTELQELIDKWRTVVQQALPDLHTEMLAEPKPTLTQLVDHLGIDHSLIQYDPEEETFGM